MTPSLTVQCDRAFSLASFCFCFSTNSLPLTFLSQAGIERGFLPVSAGSGIISSPCQPVRSLPLKSAVKPLGGVLSLGPAFSPASVQLVVRPNARAKQVGANHCRIVIVLSGGSNRCVVDYPATDDGQMQAEN